MFFTGEVFSAFICGNLRPILKSKGGIEDGKSSGSGLCLRDLRHEGKNAGSRQGRINLLRSADEADGREIKTPRAQRRNQSGQKKSPRLREKIAGIED
jgi:hypothetical protein